MRKDPGTHLHEDDKQWGQQSYTVAHSAVLTSEQQVTSKHNKISASAITFGWLLIKFQHNQFWLFWATGQKICGILSAPIIMPLSHSEQEIEQ